MFCKEDFTKPRRSPPVSRSSLHNMDRLYSIAFRVARQTDRQTDGSAGRRDPVSSICSRPPCLVSYSHNSIYRHV